MVFSSMTFLYFFLPIVLAAYYLLPGRGNWRNGLLLAASAVFYAWAQPMALLLLAGSIAGVYGIGLLLGRLRDGRGGALLFWAGVACLLGILFYYKYAAFFAGSLNGLLGTHLPVVRAALPVGISFYTFQMISYLADVRRGDAPERDFFLFCCGMLLFINISAGPITRYPELRPQLQARQTTGADFSRGTWRLCIGLGKKAILSAALGELCTGFLASAERSTLYCWLYALALSLQIYFDFSGYSDMALGLGAMFGLRLPENFNYPFMACSVSDFWRRWHISLGTWFRDYLYIPLGGSRRGRGRMVLALAAVWAFTGLWHGASWNYLCWGLYFGVLVIAEKLFWGKWLKRLPAWLGWVYTALAAVVSFVIFGGQTLKESGEILRGMFCLQAAGTEGIYAFRNYGGTLLLSLIAATPLAARLCARLERRQGWRNGLALLRPLWAAVLLLLSTAWLADGSFSPFLYFRF